MVKIINTFCDADWTQEDATVPGGTTHLWEESWDDDDENDDFSKALRYEGSRNVVVSAPFGLTMLQRGTEEVGRQQMSPVLSMMNSKSQALFWTLCATP